MWKGIRMKIGIGLPTTIPGVKGGEVIEWAKREQIDKLARAVL